MAKERKQDLGDPAEDRLEQRVDDMLAVEHAREADTTLAESAVPVPAQTATPLNEESAEPATAPLLPGKRTPKEPLRISVTEHQPSELDDTITAVNDQLQAERIPAPDELPEEPAESSQQESPTTSEGEAPDNDLDAAVDAIVAEESDALLEAEDRQRQSSVKPTSARRRNPLGRFLADWWHAKWARWALIVFILAVIGAAFTLPTTRYYTLNTVGVRSEASVEIIDQSTQQPLKNVTVKLADQTAQTDASGRAQFAHLKLGLTELTIQKRAFATLSQQVTLGWGSNPLGDFKLSPVGSQYSFVVTDYLSGKPIAHASATSSYADANADNQGNIKLTLDQSATGNVEVTIHADGYRDEVINLAATNKQQLDVKLVQSRKVAFVSNRSGKYDVYKIDIDGKNEQVALPATGNERNDMVLVPHPTKNIVAVVSTRDNVRNADGYLLSTLTIVNLDDNSARTVTQSEQIQVIGWNDDRLAYVQIAAGASAANPNRERLMSYDLNARDNKQLTSANYFNDVLAANGVIYYAPSGYQGAASNFTRINFDGSGKQVILAAETWNAFRISYDHIILSVPGQWYDFTIGQNAPVKLPGQPGNLAARVYVDSPDGKRSLWVDNRDGKGVLLLYDTQTKTDTSLLTASGLSYPVQWLDDHTIVYRISNDQETADYVMSLDGGEPHKIQDVTTTGSNDRWYYY